MKIILLIVLGFLLPFSKVFSQGEDNIWVLGSTSFNFNLFPPAPGGFSGGGQQAVMCDANGQLLFSIGGDKIWDRNSQVMPNSAGLFFSWRPHLLVPMPGNADKYYAFYLTFSGHNNSTKLFYSIIDMQLNGGLGDVLRSSKNIQLDYANTELMPSKITAIQGCNSIWVVVHAADTNEYLAYEITTNGINPVPIISHIGAVKPNYFNTVATVFSEGFLKASPDGKKLASAYCGAPCCGGNPEMVGLEVYDFDAISGRLTNAIVLDSASSLSDTNWVNKWYCGVCFSPDNSKLYAGNANKMYQFDLSLSSIIAMKNSKTLVLTNPIGAWPFEHYLGGIKRGPDEKVYTGNSEGGEMWPYMSFMHVINRPNLAGMACQPQLSVHFLGYSRLADGGAIDPLPADIVVFHVPDTAYGVKNTVACFRDSIVLEADTGKYYVWGSGEQTRNKTVYEDGSYIVRYTNLSCEHQIDTFKVIFHRQLPLVGPKGYSCPDGHTGIISFKQATGDTTVYTYTWKDANAQVLRTSQSAQGDKLEQLNPGAYYITIATTLGCDTTMLVVVDTLPVPTASFTADSLICPGASVAFENTSAASLSYWYFDDGSQSTETNPSHTYLKNGSYEVALVAENIERCTDTAVKTIEVRALKLLLIASEAIADKGSTITLQSSGSEPYTVTAWQPASLFTDQQAYGQTFRITDSGKRFVVFGQSHIGCIDSAEVFVSIRPIVFVPSAFSPNGDGVNDYFRPRSWAGTLKVTTFSIYDRWGKQVWNSTGSSENNGWDGTQNGTAADMGVYYYVIILSSADGELFVTKGDVTLLR